MKRRNFIAAIGVAPLAHAIPAPVLSNPATFTQYEYGVAVFHARTRASLTSADLVSRMSLTSAQAEGMMRKMLSDGYVKAAGKTMVQAISQNRKIRVKDAIEAFEKLTNTGAQEPIENLEN